MSVSGSAGETKTAIFNLEVAAGTDEQIERDAMEDRKILGYEISRSLDTGTAVAFFWIGADPYEDGDFTKDNEQFAAGGNVTRDLLNSQWFGDDGPDWNEDATVTLEVGEIGGTDDTEVTLHVYYQEL